jgi:hypothetical protein
MCGAEYPLFIIQIMDNQAVTKILFLAANPKNTSTLRLDEEVREIDEGLKRATHRDRFELKQQWAVRPRDMQRAVLELNPRIVHFSGHGHGSEGDRTSTPSTRKLSTVAEVVGSPEGLVLEDESGQARLVSAEALADLFELVADRVECVLLNACYSVAQAEAIAQHIPYVIGMNREIGDTAARVFAVGFYDALGAGRDIEFAFKSGCVAIQMAGIPEELTPVLMKRSDLLKPHKTGVQPSKSEVGLETIPLVEIAEPPQQPPQSQSIGNVTISGSNNPFNAIQSAGNVSLSQSNTQSIGSNSDLEAVLAILLKLKQEVPETDVLSSFAKKDTQSKISMLQEELQKPKPDKNFVNEVVDALKQGLSGVLTFVEPMTQVVTLLAKAWGGFP